MHNLSNSLPEPEAAALYALLSAWCATANSADVAAPPRFSIDGSDLLDLYAAARHLTALPKPLCLDPYAEANLLRVQTVHLNRSDAPGPPDDYRPLVPGSETEARVLVIGGRTRLRLSPHALSTAARDYRVLATCGSAGDVVGSGFVGGLGLPRRELEGITEVLLLGRNIGHGWSMTLPVEWDWDTSPA